MSRVIIGTINATCWALIAVLFGAGFDLALGIAIAVWFFTVLGMGFAETADD